MRARRAGNAADRLWRYVRREDTGGGPPWARLRWARRYRALRSAQPVWASRRPTRPNRGSNRRDADVRKRGRPELERVGLEVGGEQLLPGGAGLLVLGGAALGALFGEGAV